MFMLKWFQLMEKICVKIMGVYNFEIPTVFLAHLWCAYAMALCLSWIVRREVGCVCVEHNYPKMWMD